MPPTSYPQLPVTPELVHRRQQEATVSSRTKTSKVSLSMNEHLNRAETYHSGHKKQHSALIFEYHQLSESLRKLDQSFVKLDDQFVIAKRYSDALPPYDSRSHDTMRTELNELESSMSTVTALKEESVTMLNALQEMTATVQEEMNFIQAVVLRDKFITATDSTPRRDDPKLLSTVTSKVGEILPSITDRLAGATMSSSIPRRDPTPILPSPSRSRINGSNWPQVITDTYTAAGELLRKCAALKARAEAQTQQMLNRCVTLRNQVVKDQSFAIDHKVLTRQKLLSDIDALDGKIYDTKRMWRSTSDTVKRMKEPLNTSDARHNIRDTVEDNVGHALVDEKAAIQSSRHDLKKMCKLLSNQVDDLEKQRKAKYDELNALDKELKTDRENCGVENPLGILARPHPIRIAAIRTFPHLLVTREIFGTSGSSVSSSRLENSQQRAPSRERAITPRAPLANGGGNDGLVSVAAIAAAREQLSSSQSSRGGTPRIDQPSPRATVKVPAPPVRRPVVA